MTRREAVDRLAQLDAEIVALFARGTSMDRVAAICGVGVSKVEDCIRRAMMRQRKVLA